MEWLIQPLMMLLTSGISAALGWVSSRYKQAKRQSEERQEEHESMKRACILFMGYQLDTLCQSYEHDEEHDPAEAQAIIDTWEVYSGCGGDGVRAARVEKLTGIRVEEKEKEE